MLLVLSLSTARSENIPCVSARCNSTVVFVLLIVVIVVHTSCDRHARRREVIRVASSVWVVRLFRFVRRARPLDRIGRFFRPDGGDFAPCDRRDLVFRVEWSNLVLDNKQQQRQLLRSDNYYSVRLLCRFIVLLCHCLLLLLLLLLLLTGKEKRSKAFACCKKKGGF